MTTNFEKLLLETYYQGVKDERNNKDNLHFLEKAYAMGRKEFITKEFETTQEEDLISLILS